MPQVGMCEWFLKESSREKQSGIECFISRLGRKCSSKKSKEAGNVTFSTWPCKILKPSAASGTPLTHVSILFCSLWALVQEHPRLDAGERRCCTESLRSSHFVTRKALKSQGESIGSRFISYQKWPLDGFGRVYEAPITFHKPLVRNHNIVAQTPPGRRGNFLSVENRFI